MTKEEHRPIVWDKGPEDDEEDMATSDFEEFKNEAFILGTGWLCGCTTLVIVSRKGVYYAHYWGNISFAPDEKFKFKDADEAFKKTVVKGLTEGIEWEQTSLKNYAGKIDDEYIRAYLMIPHETWDDIPDGYRDKWNQIKSIVGDFIPKLKGPARWKDKNDALLDNTARGRILFKFDPDHRATPNQQQGRKKAILWIEGNRTPHHDDVW